MTPQTEPADPDFIKALSTDIHGMYAVQIQRFTPEKVESEFRKIVHQANLTSDDGFMDNLFFVVRKKDILTLRLDVESALRDLGLKPHAELSALKTLYAIGGERERFMVDERFARLLFADFKAGDGIPTGPCLPAADRIGGQKTLAVLETLLPEATGRQRQAEQATPGNHMRIGQLDKVRSTLDTEIHLLSRKLKVAASPDPQRTLGMLEFYLRNAGPLASWSFVELANSPSPARIETIRRFLAGNVDSILPRGLKEEDRRNRIETARLRGLVLLRAMKAQLSPEEEKLLEPHPASSQPDWEDALDSN